MKKKLTYILILLISIFSFGNNVNAAAGFSGIGTVPSGSGGGGGSCDKKYCLSLAPMLKFSLVQIDGNNLNVLEKKYMINTSGTYSSIFESNKNVDFGTPCPRCIRGEIRPGDYSDGAYSVTEFPSDISFIQETLKGIVPTNKEYIQFSVENLKKAVVSCDASGNCENTDSYDKVVVYMMKNAGIIDNSITRTADLDNSVKSQLNNYRIIIEPVYAIKKDDNNFMFATIKALAKMRKATGNSYGFLVYQLYNNLIADEKVGTAINNYSSYQIKSDSASQLNDMASVSDGAGYAIVRLSYDMSPETCKIEKNPSGLFEFFDHNGTKFYNNLEYSADGGFPGSNLEYLMQNCTCRVVDESAYKNELLVDNVLNQVYERNCNPQHPVCSYEYKNGTYSFYDRDGNSASDYSEFINSCGCDHANVLALKNTFSTAYNASGCNTEETITPTGQFGYCTLNNTVSLERKKEVNEYCTRTCTETINFNNVLDTSGITYNAGEFFGLSTYPTLQMNKTCKVEFDYNKWINEYKTALTTMVSNYNNWKKYSNVTTTDSDCADPDDYVPKYYYQFNYNGFKINSDGLTLNSNYFRNDGNYSGNCGASKTNYSSTANSYKNQYESAAIKIQQLKGYIQNCNSAIDFEGDNFYNFQNNLEFHYQQDLLKNNTIESKWNENRTINDSAMKGTLTSTTSYCNGISTNRCSFPTFHLFDNISGSSIEQNNSKINSSEISRTQSYNYKYSPEIPKYVEPYTGIINLSRGSYLGNVYDLEVNAVEKDNNSNYFKFTSLGENPTNNNSLYKVFTRNDIDALTRKCTYQINNDLFDCTNGVCNSGNDSILNVMYRSVDPNNIDPNNRSSKTDKGFTNWKNKKGETVQKEIENNAKNNNTYNPDNLEYSFTLDSATIKDIRENVNSISDYLDFKLKCNVKDSSDPSTINSVEGNECESDFVEKYADNIDGRKKWKYMSYNNINNTWSIKEYDKYEMTTSLFENLQNKLGGITP